MKIEHLPASCTPEQLAEIIRRDGAVIVDQLVSCETMDMAIAELTPWIDATPFGGDEFAGKRTKRTGGLIARSATCRDLVMNPTVIGAVGDFLKHATSFQLHLTQVIAIGPGEPAQSIHRDQWAFDFFPFPPGYEIGCNTIWAMTDFTEENGATRVIPGSHKAADRLEYKFEDTIAADMTKGSVLIYSGSVYHSGGANKSNATRMGLNLTYNVSWLRQEENQYLSVPREIAQTLPVNLLRMMGYQKGAFALGYIDDTRDPIEALFPDYKPGSAEEAHKKMLEAAHKPEMTQA